MALKGGQKKLDKNKDGKITGEDFKMMKQGYGAARKDGMGLQDESIKPGKIQKAGLGKMIKKIGRVIGFGGKKAASASPGTQVSGSTSVMGGMLPKLLQKAIDDGLIKGARKGRMMKASKGGGADTGRVGEMKSKLALAKDKFKKIKGTISSPEMKFIKQAIPGEAPRSIGTKIAEAVKKAKAKKMGGGMMQKYQTGGSVMARGCKLGRKKATKLY